MKVVFLGGGNMASAIVRGLVSRGGYEIFVGEIDSERRERLSREFPGVTVGDSIVPFLPSADCLVLAVKPQDMSSALREPARLIEEKTVVLSIAAGLTSGVLLEMLGRNLPLVRAMPNTPALTGRGITALAQTSTAQKEHLKICQTVMAAVGEVVCVEEQMMDIVTAVSGSGPAYFFYLAERLIAAAVEQGMGKELANRLVIETFAGAGELARNSADGVAELRKKVTSKGGTTAAALEKFHEARFEEMVSAAVNAAVARSRELSNP